MWGGAEEEQTAMSTEPDAGLVPTTLRSRPDPKPRVGCLTDCTTQAPLKTEELKNYEKVIQVIQLKIVFCPF